MGNEDDKLSSDDEDIADLFDTKQYESSDDSCQTLDEDQIIEVGDIIQFYHEGFVKGHNMAHPWAKIEDIVPKEDNYIRTDIAYIFSHDTEVKIIKKMLPSGKYVNFEKGKTMHLKKYHFKHLSDEERKEFNRKKEERRRNRVKRKFIHDENVPFPAIDKVSRAKKKVKVNCLKLKNSLEQKRTI